MTDRNPGNRHEGGDLVVESLKNLGVGQIFSVSGGVINSIYRAAAVHDENAPASLMPSCRIWPFLSSR